MVNLVKARAKAKKRENPPPTSGNTPPAIDKLEKFKAEAGRRREGSIATAAVVQDRDELELLTFAIDGERYAIDVERVIEIAPSRPLTRVPNAEEFVLGVVSLRGVVVTMVDVRGRLRHPRGDGQQVIVVTDRGGPIGFDVDRVLRPMKLPADAIEAHPVVSASEERPSIRGVFRQSGTLTILLDLDKLLS